MDVGVRVDRKLDDVLRTALNRVCWRLQSSSFSESSTVYGKQMQLAMPSSGAAQLMRSTQAGRGEKQFDIGVWGMPIL